MHTDVKLPEDKVNKVMEDRLSSCKNDSCRENNLGTYSINIRKNPGQFSKLNIQIISPVNTDVVIIVLSDSSGRPDSSVGSAFGL